jgi:peptidyl-prolyl cis-trans isomerase SurA
VKAAQELRLDTLQQLRYDLQNFRSQVDEGYMNNEDEVNALVNEAFARSQRDLHVVHFFAPLDAKMSPADTLNAYRAMNELQERLNTGSENYKQMAQDLSGKYVTVKATDLGFITVFSLPYEYENILYGMTPGTSCKPYRTKNGLHVFKVTEQRPAAGTWKIAQILLAFPPGDPASYSASLQSTADSIYNALKQGADFSKMAARFSDDKLTYMTGGEMPEFGTGKFDPDFEKVVFSLARDGEIGRPFSSQYGIHIIKRLKKTDTPSDRNDATFRYELKQKVLQDARINAAKQRFVKEILNRIGYKKNPAVKEADLYRFADSAMANRADTAFKRYPISDKIVFSMAKTNAQGSDWLRFVRDYKGNAELYKGENNAELFNRFVSSSALEFYKKHLEEYNPEFRYQMEEFRDGNVLFEIMERKVWGSAASDSVGLLKHYNENKKNYLWAASASVILFNCSNKETAEAAVAALKNGKDWRKIVADGNNNIQADSGRYEIAQLPISGLTNALPGMITEPVINPADNTASFLKIVETYAGGLQRSFEEARGLVINDYQNILEEKWVDELKKKYPVKVNEQVFQSLLK